MRRSLGTALLLALAAPSLRAQGRPDDGMPSGVERPRRRSGQEPGIPIDNLTQTSVMKALRYLAEHQNRDGSWTDMVGRKVHNTYEGEVQEHVGVTALAGMAFLASG